MNTEIIEKMTLYKIRETFETPKFDLNILLNKNPDYDFIILNLTLTTVYFGILSVQNLKPGYIKLQIKNKSKLVIIENEIDKTYVIKKSSIFDYIKPDNINFVGQVVADELYIYTNNGDMLRYFKTQYSLFYSPNYLILGLGRQSLSLKFV